MESPKKKLEFSQIDSFLFLIMFAFFTGFSTELTKKDRVLEGFAWSFVIFLPYLLVKKIWQKGFKTGSKEWLHTLDDQMGKPGDRSSFKTIFLTVVAIVVVLMIVMIFLPIS